MHHKHSVFSILSSFLLILSISVKVSVAIYFFLFGSPANMDASQDVNKSPAASLTIDVHNLATSSTPCPARKTPHPVALTKELSTKENMFDFNNISPVFSPLSSQVLEKYKNLDPKLVSVINSLVDARIHHLLNTSAFDNTSVREKSQQKLITDEALLEKLNKFCKEALLSMAKLQNRGRCKVSPNTSSSCCDHILSFGLLFH